MLQYHYRVTLTESEYQLLLRAMLNFRNRVAGQNGPTEDINEVIVKITKAHRKHGLF